MSYETFPTQQKHYLDRHMWLDGSVDIARYDKLKFPQFHKLTKEQLSFLWTPEEISLSTDVKNFKTMDPHLEHIFTANLKRQILLDSVQGRAPVEVLLPLVSQPEMERWIITWSCDEEIHSDSYTHMIRSMYTNPSVVFDELRDIPEIEECASDISKHYDNLANFDGEYGSYEHKTLLWMCINAINALEGVRFYVSFACTYAFGRIGLLPGSSDIIRLINQDEELHRKGTTEMLKAMLKDDPDYVQIKKEQDDNVREMFMEVVKQECDWADYLFKHGAMLGLTSPMLKEYINWLAHRRMKSVGVEPGYTVNKADPLPWVSAQLNEGDTQKSPQEEELTAYQKGSVKQDFDTSDLGFTL